MKYRCAAIASTAPTSASTRPTRTSTCRPRSCGRTGPTIVRIGHVRSSPPGSSGRIATQLHAGSSPLEFTAPNLQYFMDSPVEFGPIAMRAVHGRTGGASASPLHHRAPSARARRLRAATSRRSSAQEGRDLRRVSALRAGHYTFLADYLPCADGDGMEHRNSTVITSSRRSRAAARDCSTRSRTSSSTAGTSSASVRRASSRSISIAPNMSGELWLAEGFTQYYGPLVLQRAGLADLSATARTLDRPDRDGDAATPAAQVRSAEEMSRMAPFIDGGRTIDRTNWSNTVISYYPFGGAIALALDLSLRDRIDGACHARRLHARDVAQRTASPAAAARATSIVRTRSPTPRRRWPTVSGDPQFARDFFARYIQGHDVADYAQAARARRLQPSYAPAPAAPGSATVRLRLRGTAPRRGAGRRRRGRCTRRASIRTMSCSSSMGRRSNQTRMWRRCSPATSLAIRFRSCSWTGPASPRTCR